MEIIAKINKFEDIDIINNCNSFLLANSDFSYRYDESFCISKIKKITQKCHKEKKKVYLLVNKIFKDDEIDKLYYYIEKTNELNVDGYFFTDFAVFMILKEKHLEDKAFFYHETFLRNSYDIKTYQELGIKNIICSKDMNIEDIRHLDTNLKKTYGILCFGYYPLYESQRKLLTHYCKLNNLDKSIASKMNLSLKETTRSDDYKIIQQKGICSIFDSKVLNYLPYIEELKENIEMFIVDSLFLDATFINEVINQLLNYCQYDENKLLSLNPNIKFSDAFLHKRIGLK